MGHHSVVFSTLSKTAYAAVAISGVVSILSYTISYRSSMLKGFQSAGIASYPISGIRKIWSWVLHKTVLKGTIERASFHFVAQTIFRRQEHMLYWGSFVMMGIAFIYADCCAIGNGNISDPSQRLSVLLSFALTMSFFILVGLRFAFSIPADLNANWIFRIIDKQQLERYYRGVYKFMLGAINIPLLIIFAPCYLMAWGPRLVVCHIIYVSILSLILIELLLFRYIKLPFTCSYLPGKTNIVLLWPAYVLACIIYSYGTTVLERWMLHGLIRYVILIVAAGVIFIGINRYRSIFLKRIGEIRFEEEPANQINILSIEG